MALAPENEVALIRELTAIRKLLAVIARSTVHGLPQVTRAVHGEIEAIEKEADGSPD